MLRLDGEDSQNEEIECALGEIDTRHASLFLLQEINGSLVEVQGENVRERISTTLVFM
jgi:hypothetical protein